MKRARLALMIWLAAVLWLGIMIGVGARSAEFQCSGQQYEAGECYPRTYKGPDNHEWYAGLFQPDRAQSCCGEADAYYADDSEFDPDGSLVAIITDTRDNKRALPNGTFINRPPVPVGTRIKVPPSKIRKPPVLNPNPTEHTIIFLANDLSVYCYEPTPLM